jgi:hypothetical protein
MDRTNIYTRSHRMSRGGVHSVVLPNGRGHVVMNNSCRKEVKPRFTQFYLFLWLREWEYLTVLMAALMMWGW